MLGYGHEPGEVSANYDEELTKGGRFTDTRHPQNENTELRMFEGKLALRVVHDQFADVH